MKRLLLMLALLVSPLWGQGGLQQEIQNVNLLEIPLLAQTYGGIDVGVTFWTGNAIRYLNQDPGTNPGPGVIEIPWTAQGYDGLRFVGQGPGATIIDGGQSGNGSIMVSAGGNGNPLTGVTGVVEFVNCEIRTAGSKAAYPGADAAGRHPHVPLAFVLTDCLVTDDASRPGGRWGVFPDQSDIVLRRTSFLGASLSEHAFYLHGFGDRGMVVDSCTFDGAYAELLKITARPNDQGGPYAYGSWYEDPAKRAIGLSRHAGASFQPVGTPAARALVRIVDSTFTRWGLGGSGGGGVVLQGGGVDMTIERCVFIANNGNKNGLAIAVDDSSVEHFGESPTVPGQWAAGEPPANGDILISECIIGVDDGHPWLAPAIGIGSLIAGNTEAVAKSVTIQACAIYGINRTLAIAQVPSVTILAINTPPLPAIAASYGIDTSQWQIAGQPNPHGVLVNIQGTGGLFPIEQGFIGSAP